MTISSWDAAYRLATYLGIDMRVAVNIAKQLVPNEYDTRLDDFVTEAAKGLDDKSLFMGAILTSVIMEKVRYTEVDGEEVVTCIICGNQKPVVSSGDDEFGWICSDCEHIRDDIHNMDRMKAMQRDIERMERTYEDKGGDIHGTT